MSPEVKRIYDLYKKLEINFVSEKSCEKIFLKHQPLPENEQELIEILIKEV